MTYDHMLSILSNIFFFNDTATTEIYTLSLHDALPIYAVKYLLIPDENAELTRYRGGELEVTFVVPRGQLDRKSTRLNSSHSQISYAVFCLKKKNKYDDIT